MIHRTSLVVLCLLLCAPAAHSASRVAKRVIRGDAAGVAERAVNGGFEEPGDAGQPSRAWGFWDRGYEIETGAVRTGTRAARCESDDPELQLGAAQTIVLGQAAAAPVIASGWSRAEGVSGSPSAGYSVYVDLTYTDGTNLWGQVAPFDTGTHDWQARQVTIVPDKPIRELTVYGLFRGHAGTVWFDDFSVGVLELVAGAQLFDAVPVTAGEPPPAMEQVHVLSDRGFSLRVDTETATVDLGEVLGCGFLLRDVAADSDFFQPTDASVLRTDNAVEIEAQCEELGLELTAVLQAAEGAVRIRGEVLDLRREDRAIAVYFVLPVDLIGGTFGHDMRVSTPLDEARTYANTVAIGAGTNGRMGRYPLCPVYRDDRALCIATPLDEPRVSRLAYDSASRELYAAFDLGLSPDTRKFPSTATFSLVVYPFDPAWGFRSALQRYYDLFAAFFTKRVEREGIWMPFTDIASVQKPEDFGFAFKEGDNNVAFDEEQGIDTFVYVEPMSHWLPLPPEVPRTYEAAVAEIERRAATETQSQATLSSGYYNADGTYHLWLLDAPWCDGALITTNPDPDLLSDEPQRMTQAGHEFATIERAFARAGRADTAAWRDLGGGFEIVTDGARSGERSARCTNPGGQEHGLSQSIVLGQTEPHAFTARAWSRAEGVSGGPESDYSLYLDLVFADGTPSYGHVAPFSVGTHDWQEAVVTVTPEKPVQSLTLHLLLRGNVTGAAWFDDVSLVETGRDENLVRDGGFEPSAAPAQPVELDGTYIDSYEMAATEQNCRREHWAYVDIPLTFGQTTREVCSLGVFHTYEFERELAAQMHPQGKLTFANAVLMNFAFPAHLLDVMGIETNWASGDQYVPNPDEVMNFRRALCYQKPYCLLLNTDYNAFRPEWVELYFKRCTFYAIFPSFFSHNAADDPYWQNPKLYNRDRPLFLQYIPVIKTLSAAGWEPVTHARVTGGEGRVYVERFGRDPTGGLYFTLFNDSDTARDYTLTIERGPVGLGEAQCTDLLTGEGVRAQREGNALVIEGALEPEDVRVLKVGSA